MNFLKDNFIFVFGALSLISLIFAASGVAKNNSISMASETNGASETAPKKIDPAAGKKPNVPSKADPKTPYQISGLEKDDDGEGQANLDD